LSLSLTELNSVRQRNESVSITVNVSHTASTVCVKA